MNGQGVKTFVEGMWALLIVFVMALFCTAAGGALSGVCLFAMIIILGRMAWNIGRWAWRRYGRCISGPTVDSRQTDGDRLNFIEALLTKWPRTARQLRGGMRAHRYRRTAQISGDNMNDDFLKPPSLGMWIALVMVATASAVAMFGEDFELLAGGTFIIGGLIALAVVARWVGRLLGVMLGGFTTGLREGYERTSANNTDPS